MPAFGSERGGEAGDVGDADVVVGDAEKVFQAETVLDAENQLAAGSKFRAGFAEEVALALLGVDSGLEGARPFENADGADGGEASFESDFEVVGFDEGQVIVNALLSSGGGDEGETFGDGLEGDDATIASERAGDLTPTGTDVENGAGRSGENGIEERGAERRGDDLVEPGFGGGEAGVDDVAPRAAGVDLGDDGSEFGGRSVAETFVARSGEALAPGELVRLGGVVEAERGVHRGSRVFD